jgi:hypothetical protein
MGRRRWKVEQQPDATISNQQNAADRRPIAVVSRHRLMQEPAAAEHSTQAVVAERRGDMTGEAVTMSGEATSNPPAEPALKVETREELVYLLGQACELEHGLMCEYLYAQSRSSAGPMRA